VLTEILSISEPQPCPWIVYTCGPMGAGKGYALSWMSEKGCVAPIHRALPRVLARPAAVRSQVSAGVTCKPPAWGTDLYVQVLSIQESGARRS